MEVLKPKKDRGWPQRHGRVSGSLISTYLPTPSALHSPELPVFSMTWSYSFVSMPSPLP